MNSNSTRKEKIIFMQNLIVELKDGGKVKYTKQGYPQTNVIDITMLNASMNEFNEFEKQIIKPLAEKSNVNFKMNINFNEYGEIDYDNIKLSFEGSLRKGRYYINELVRHVYSFKTDIKSLDIYMHENESQHSITANVITDSDSIEEFIKKDKLETSFKMIEEIRSILENNSATCEKISIPVVDGRLQLPLLKTKYAYTLSVKELGSSLFNIHGQEVK